MTLRLLTTTTVVLLLLGPLTARCDEDVDTLCSWLAGQFANIEQHGRDTTVPLTVLNIERRWPSRSDGAWFTMAQRLAHTKAPYQQRLIRVNRVEEGMIECVLYTLAGDTIGVPMHGCEWYLQATGKSFVGGTHGFACAPTGEVAFTIVEVDVRSFGIKLLELGFNAKREVVLGAPDTPLLLERAADADLPPQEPDAKEILEVIPGKP